MGSENRKSVKKKNLFIPAVVLCVIFLAGAILLFVTSCSSTALNNYLSEQAVDVTVTVQEVQPDNTYKFAFFYNDSVLYFTDRTAQSYKLGQTFTARLNPSDPKLLNPSQALFIPALVLFVLALGAPMLCKKLRFLLKFYCYPIAVAALVLIVTGVSLPYLPLCIAGLIFVSLSVALPITLRHLNKKQ